MLYQLISLAGAAMILGAYAALQRGWLGLRHPSYHLLNLLGAALLTVVAVQDRRLGFIILEGAWVLLSLPGLLRRGTGGSAA